MTLWNVKNTEKDVHATTWLGEVVSSPQNWSSMQEVPVYTAGSAEPFYTDVANFRRMVEEGTLTERTECEG